MMQAAPALTLKHWLIHQYNYHKVYMPVVAPYQPAVVAPVSTPVIPSNLSTVSSSPIETCPALSTGPHFANTTTNSAVASQLYSLLDVVPPKREDFGNFEDKPRYTNDSQELEKRQSTGSGSGSNSLSGSGGTGTTSGTTDDSGNGNSTNINPKSGAAVRRGAMYFALMTAATAVVATGL